MPVSLTVQNLTAGTLGGFIATASLYPLELIKTRMQVAGEMHGVYRSMTKACGSIWKNEGFRGFYQGVTPALIGASGSWGGYFLTYELSKERKLSKMPHGSKLGTYDHLASGVEAGVVLVFVFNPVWVVKTRLALQGVDLQQKKKYSGMYDAFVSIAREEGLRGLYKGIVPALFLTSHGAIQFAVYEYLKELGEKMRLKSQSDQPPLISAVSGGASKFIASIATYPYQVVKSRLQQSDILNSESNTFQSKYRGMWDCVVKIWKKERVVGFFRGVVPNALKVAPSSAVTFLVYEEVLKLFK